MRIYKHEELSALLTGRIDNATPEERQLALVKLGKKLAVEAIQHLRQDDWELSPLHTLLLLNRLTPFAPDPHNNERVAYYRALHEDITSLVMAHHQWRHARNGNVVWEFTGPTGSGKSSCMLGLLERLNGVKPDKLAEHLTIDVAELGNVLPRIPKGSGVVVDEQSTLVGEGSQVTERTLRNIEDQIRLTGKDLYWASPGKNREHQTSQGEFQSISTNWKKRRTRFLVWLDQTPLGRCDLPWASDEMWAAYEPLKKGNVARAERATFHSISALDEQIKRLFELDAIQLICEKRRPKAAEWRRIIRRHGPSMGTAQVQSMSEEIVSMLDVLDNAEDEFAILYNFEPTAAMLRAAGASIGG